MSIKKDNNSIKEKVSNTYHVNSFYQKSLVFDLPFLKITSKDLKVSKNALNHKIPRKIRKIFKELIIYDPQ